MTLPRILRLALLPSLILTGCGNNIPNCDDTKINELVVDLVEDHFENEVHEVTAGAVIAEVDEVRMVDYDKKNRIRQCAGRMRLAGPSQGSDGAGSRNGWQKETEIAYEISPSEDNLGYSVSVKWP